MILSEGKYREIVCVKKKKTRVHKVKRATFVGMLRMLRTTVSRHAMNVQMIPGTPEIHIVQEHVRAVVGLKKAMGFRLASNQKSGALRSLRQSKPKML